MNRIILVGVFLVGCGTHAVAQTAPAPEKLFSIAFDKKPWADVLDWFAKESGMVMIATAKPTGTVTIKTDANKTYTLAEVVVLLNRSLALQKFILLRIDATTFTVVPTDVTIPEAFIPRIELPGRETNQTDGITLKIYSVSPKTAETLARVLSEKYRDSKTVRIATVPGKDEIMILAPTRVHLDILLDGKLGTPKPPPVAACSPPVVVACPPVPCSPPHRGISLFRFRR